MTPGGGPFDESALRGGSPALSRMLAELAEPLALRRGQTLFEQGDPGDAIYALLQGALEVSVLSVSGRKLTLNTMGPGDVFGEIALFDAGPRTASVHALEDARLLRVRRSRLLDRIAHDPALAVELLALAGQRLRWISAAFEDAHFLQLGQRLARRVLDLDARFAAPDGFVALSQAELATQVGATREAVARILASWREQGWIGLGRGRLRVIHREALHALVDADPT